MATTLQGIFVEDNVRAPQIVARRKPAFPRTEQAGFAGTPEVELLKSDKDIVSGYISEEEALRDDPVFKYCINPPAAMLAQKTVVDQALQVDHGHSVAVFSPPADPDGSPKPAEHWLVRVLGPVMKYSASPQQRRRIEEMTKKIRAAELEYLGDKDKYFALELLATHPKYQGRGYGSALLKALAWMADEAERPTWLVSSNIVNKAFYESFGYQAVAEIILGDEDPDHTEKPIVTLLMIRQPEKAAPVDEKAAVRL
ncbi:hypothetical protein FA95DRAFT_1605567 [Auriscalpium vulgare]|uniref:Uncharacterized protein n=1 Tax=Auriscalpium vulgare TaxID=40419 RepID=A0ACB8RV48_9AGAM|nr:hypothetical protein FA95DRAFT_1605567 [Auriscalpium vulgare]